MDPAASWGGVPPESCVGGDTLQVAVVAVCAGQGGYDQGQTDIGGDLGSGGGMGTGASAFTKGQPHLTACLYAMLTVPVSLTLPMATLHQEVHISKAKAAFSCIRLGDTHARQWIGQSQF